jgi:hypothetical protein
MAKKVIDVFYFVSGGVVLPRLAQLTIGALEGQCGRRLENKLRIAVYYQEKRLFMGQSGAGEYLAAICALGVWLAGREALEVELLQRMQVKPGVLAVAGEMTKEGRVYLYANIPRPWLDQVGLLTGLFNYFDRQNVLNPSDLLPRDDLEGFFAALKSRGHALPGRAMWLDANPLRTAAAIRCGIDALIYVDERRLRRELGLRCLPGGSPEYN